MMQYSLADEAIATSPPNQALWARIDALLAICDEPPPELRGIAAWRAELRGDTETAQRFHDYRRSIAYGNVSVRPILERVRDATGQPMLLLKGPEVAAIYPATTLRPFGDLDLLLPDAARAERDLLAAGFTQNPSPLTEPVPWHHHRLPLKLPGTALSIELHRDPGWLTWMTPPSNRELFARAVPSATGVEGVTALPPLEQTLFLAMHSWRHGPYHSLLHMIDIELMRQGIDPDELVATAQRWGIERVWRYTTDLLDWCFHDPDHRLSPLERVWSGHIREMRSRSLRSSQLAIRAKALGVPSAQEFPGAMEIEVLQSLAPRPGETFEMAIRRILRKLRG